MKLRVFLNLFSCCFLACSHASNFEGKLLWGDGKLTKSNQSIELLTGTEDGYFLSIPIKALNFNINTENIYFDYRLNNLKNFHGLEVRLSEKENDKSYYSYTLPYFSDPDFNIFKEDQWTKIGLSRANFKEINSPSQNIKYLSFFLFSYKKPVHLQLKDFSKKSKPKEGYATVTFDDGYKSQLLAAEITNKYGIPATAYIMPRNVGEPGLMDLKDLKSLISKDWEIQSHHATPLIEFTPKELEEEFKFAVDYIEKNKLASKTHHLAYPLGKHNQKIIDITEKHFKTARVAGAGIETIPTADNYRLRTFNVLSTTTTDELKEVILRAKSQKQWVIFMFHYLREKSQSELDYTPENFEKFCKILNESKIKVLTISQMQEKISK